jgi:putative ABC transport system permease protein
LQNILGSLAGSLFLESLPTPSYFPVLIGFSVSFSVLFALMLPNIHAIKNSAVVQILRTDLETKTTQASYKFLPLMIVVALIILSLAKSAKLAVAVILGILLLCLLSGGLAYLFATLIYRFSQSSKLSNIGSFNMVKIGLANLKRNRLLTIAQVIGFSLSAMVLILLLIVKNDLLNAWQDSLPVDAPNHFVINIQPEQIKSIEAFTKSIGVVNPQVFPMIRGRLIMKNNQPISPDLYEDARAKRLASREFNLSMAANLQSDNHLLEGEWWQVSDSAKPVISIEQDVASALNIKLGDLLTYDIAGRQINLTVSSVRKVDWDSMRANFFAVTPPQTLSDFPASYMTGFHLERKQSSKLNQLVKRLPNLTVIDVASLMEQVRGIMQKMSLAVAYVFILCLIAGLVVLYAALVATRDARVKEASLLRVFGASRKQVSVAMIVEYFGIALIAASIALIVANGIASYVSTYLFGIPFSVNAYLTMSAFLIAIILIPSSAWFVIRTYLNQPPKQLLNSI